MFLDIIDNMFDESVVKTAQNQLKDLLFRKLSWPWISKFASRIDLENDSDESSRI